MKTSLVYAITPQPQARHKLVFETSINGPMTSTGLSAREQEKQGCSTRENKPGAESDGVPEQGQGGDRRHPQGEMVGQGQGHSKSSSRRLVWRYATDTVDARVHPGSAVSARTAGDRTGLRAELQHSSGEPWISELNL